MFQTALPGRKIIFCHQIMEFLCAVSTDRQTQTRVTGLEHKLYHIIKSGGFASDRKDVTLKEGILRKWDQVELN